MYRLHHVNGKSTVRTARAVGGESLILYMYFIKYTTCIIFQYDRAFYISVRSTIFAEEVKLIGEGEGWGTFTR